MKLSNVALILIILSIFGCSKDKASTESRASRTSAVAASAAASASAPTNPQAKAPAESPSKVHAPISVQPVKSASPSAPSQPKEPPYLLQKKVGLYPDTPLVERMASLDIKVVPRDDLLRLEPPNTEEFEAMEEVQGILIGHTSGAGVVHPVQEQDKLEGICLSHMQVHKWADCAYHWAIGPSGKVYRLRDEAYKPASGFSYYPPFDGKQFISVVLIGEYDESGTLTPAMKKSILELVADRAWKHGVREIKLMNQVISGDLSSPGDQVTTWWTGKQGAYKRLMAALPKEE